MRAAFIDGCDYLYQASDDNEIITKDFFAKAIEWTEMCREHQGVKRKNMGMVSRVIGRPPETALSPSSAVTLLDCLAAAGSHTLAVSRSLQLCPKDGPWPFCFQGFVHRSYFHAMGWFFHPVRAHSSPSLLIPAPSSADRMARWLCVSLLRCAHNDCCNMRVVHR